MSDVGPAWHDAPRVAQGDNLTLHVQRCIFVSSATPVGGHVFKDPRRGDAKGVLLFEMKVSVHIDGGHLRVLVRTKARAKYDPDVIERIAHACVGDDERLLRAFYYDCPPFVGERSLPVSGKSHRFEGSDEWLRRLGRKDLFALRLGVLKFRGFKPKRVPISSEALTDEDFKPDFEQKGVDMRIGLDIATLSQTHAVDRVILITNDTDCIPAMKHGRKAGLQIVLMSFPGQGPAAELLEHADFHRRLAAWSDI